MSAAPQPFERTARTMLLGWLLLGGSSLSPPGLLGAENGAIDGEDRQLDSSDYALSVTLSRETIQVGDLVEALLEFNAAPGSGEPAFPNWQGHWGNAEIREVGAVVRSGISDAEAAAERPGRSVRYRQTLVLTAFRPGTVTLPPATVTVPGQRPASVSTESASFEVESVLPEGEEVLEPRPPEPPRALPLGDRFWWTAGVLSLLAAGLLALVLSRRRGESAVTETPVDPWDALEAALAELALASDAEIAFTGLSLELRRYLGRTLALPAAESTTTELRRRLRKTGLPASICAEVVALLVEADTVKFARENPLPGRVQACIDQARAAAGDVRSFLQPQEDSRQNGEAA